MTNNRSRDIIGAKSIYYVVDGKPIFATNLGYFLGLDGFVPEIDREALQYYLSCGYCPNRRTIFKGVFKVLPAETVEFDNGEMWSYKYWAPPSAKITGGQRGNEEKY